jgi:hypothetical protein
MSQEYFVYGAFEDNGAAAQLVEKLHDAGFAKPSISVVGQENSPEFKHVAARITNRAHRFFIASGIAGAVGGLTAAIMYQPAIPYSVSFQLIVPVMAMVAGAILLGYFGMYIGMFLHANQPNYYANVFEGQVTNGAVIVCVEVNSKLQRALAAEMVSMLDPIELVIRSSSLGPISNVLPAGAKDFAFTQILEAETEAAAA